MHKNVTIVYIIMKHIITLFLLFFAFFGNSDAQQLNNLLKDLDNAIQMKGKYHKQQQGKIDSLKTLIKVASDAELYSIYNQIYECYSNYQVDSAYQYITKMDNLDAVKRNRSLSLMVDMKKAITFGIMGDFASAINIVDTINMGDASADIRSEYFHTCRTVYGWYAEYTKDFHHNDNRYERITQSYRDSILRFTEPGIRRNNVLADNYIVKGEADVAIEILHDILANAKDEQKVYAYYNLAQCYKMKGNDEKYAIYLALTAISDIKNGVTEYIALPELASLMLKMGDVDRAYNYLFCSMEDAHFCGAFLRTFEVNTIFPIIDKEYREQERRNQLFEHSVLTGVCVLAVILILALFYLQKQMKRVHNIKEKLSEANKRLAVANSQLEEANLQLADANSQLQGSNFQLGENNDMLSRANDILQNTNKIKEEYIAHYLEMCRSYMDTFENFRKSLLRLAKSNQHQEIMKLLKSDDVMEDEQKRFFADFDKSFLNIHPDFIKEFNALLNEESQLVPKKGELLNIELRIFALIRLGVDDSAMIAHFLNYSLPTIYNYRSRIRNNSIYDKDEFNHRLMAIS